MSQKSQRYERLLFNYESTLRTDFRDGEIKKLVQTAYQPKPVRTRPKYHPIKDLHSLNPWKNPIVPFDLYHKPKEAVRTNPRDVQQPYAKPVDDIREQVQKTRPRLVMTPAIFLDDVEDPVKRQIILDAVYTTRNQLTMQKTATDVGVKAPFAERPALATPIYLEKLQPPVVSPEWRMDSVSWDSRQDRAYCDSTKEFWLRFNPEPNRCGTYHFT